MMLQKKLIVTFVSTESLMFAVQTMSMYVASYSGVSSSGLGVMLIDGGVTREREKEGEKVRREREEGKKREI